ncbi:MmcQ/YjbR family DNA-binding protein [Lysobacter korlensis]|uniref:MmcQ/YjbR family DNA-binding protein n=2 Tax=Lysobacter korlensis TaxID=553636 RepID=A0ABV6RKF8_9GAMM
MDEVELRDLTRWPVVEAQLKWQDDLVFSVAGKMFCVLCVQGPQAGAISFTAEDGRFLELAGQPGFVPAPYLALARWVQLPVPSCIASGELRALIRRSYELVRARLLKKVRHELAD